MSFFSKEIVDVKPVFIKTSMFASFWKMACSSSLLFTSFTWWHIIFRIGWIIKEAQNSFQYFLALILWWVSATNIYQLPQQKWYQTNAQSLINKLWLFSWRHQFKLLRRNFFNFAKSCTLTCWSLFNSTNGGHRTCFWVINT